MKIKNEKVKIVITFIKDRAFILYNYLDAFLARVVLTCSKLSRYFTNKIIPYFRKFYTKVSTSKYKKNISIDNKFSSYINKYTDSISIPDKVKSYGILYVIILLLLLITNNFSDCSLIDDKGQIINFLKNGLSIKEGNNNNIIINKTKDFYIDVIDEGKDIYSYSDVGYRYDPAIINNDNGYDIYYSSRINDHSFISYQHYIDGQLSNEQVLIEALNNGLDVDDISQPTVVYYSGYYYLAYSAKFNGYNNIFVSRSINVNGPFDSWDGEGWSNMARPLIHYDDDINYEGVSSPSLLIVDGKLFCFYILDCPSGKLLRLAKFDLTYNWPNTYIDLGTCMKLNKNIKDFNIVYLDDEDKYIGYTTNNELTEKSNIEIYVSNNNLKFSKVNNLTNNLTAYMIGAGISTNKYGRINLDDEGLLIYGYADEELKENNYITRLHDIKIVSNLENKDNKKAIIRTISNNNNEDYIIGITSINKNKVVTMGSICYLDNRYYDRSFNLHKLNNIEYEYDENMVSIVGNTLFPIKEGNTIIKVKSENYYTRFMITIINKNIEEERNIIKLDAIDKNIFVFKNSDLNSLRQIRLLATYNDGINEELYNLNNNRLIFEVIDENIVKVDELGYIKPINVGETDVIVKYKDLQYIQHIIVKK